MLRNRRGQWALIELLVVVAIIAAAAYYVYPRYLTGGPSHTKTDPPTVLERAQGMECGSNLSQIRAAIHMYQSSNEKFPATLEDMKSHGVDKSISTCPISGTPYTYDPSTGKVWCTTPGHQKF